MSDTQLAKRDSKPLTFTPVGERDAITLTMATVRNHIVSPTKSGKVPDDSMILQFMMLCKARGLNPYTGDAIIQGYDGKNGPEFSIISSKAALDKRADLNENYDGMESGVIILNRSGELERREGAIVLDDAGETLIGGWAKVYRDDRRIPHTHEVQFSVYDTGRSRWAKDPAGMIVKVAEAGALRKAFPNSYAGLYMAEEFEKQRMAEEVEVTSVTTTQAEGKPLPSGFQRPSALPEKREETPAKSPEPAAANDEAPEVVGEPVDQEPEQEAPPAEEPPPKPSRKRAGGVSKGEGKTAPAGAVHEALLERAIDEDLTATDLVRAATALFGEQYRTLPSIPEARAQKMLDEFDDVLAYLKS